MTPTSWLRWRVGLSAVFGLALTVITFIVVAPTQYGMFEGEHSYMLGRSRMLERLVNEYHTTHKVWPTDLLQVYPPDTNLPSAIDPWGRPFLYSIHDNKPLIESLGRDGVRGGIGLDADLSNQHPHPPEAQLPLLQAMTHPLGRYLTGIAFLCGLVAAGLVFVGLRDTATDGLYWQAVVLQLGVQFVMAVFLAGIGAIFIAGMHFSYGH